MTYNEIYKILFFEKKKLITTKLIYSQKIIWSLSLVVRSSMEPNILLLLLLFSGTRILKNWYTGGFLIIFNKFLIDFA